MNDIEKTKIMEAMMFNEAMQRDFCESVYLLADRDTFALACLFIEGVFADKPSLDDFYSADFDFDLRAYELDSADYFRRHAAIVHDRLSGRDA